MKHTSAPIIGAINGVTAVRWKDYTVHMEQAGPDVLELDFYHAANDLSEPGRGIERRFIGPEKRKAFHDHHQQRS